MFEKLFSKKQIILVVGLGNPGTEHQSNRHNVGFLVLDRLNEALNGSNFKMEKKYLSEISENTFSNKRVILVKPQTFMNESGRAISIIKNFYKIPIQKILLVHDDLDLNLGEIKMHKKGPRVHNGVNSVEKYLDNFEELNRIRIGVENRNTKKKVLQGKEFLLSNFSTQEMEILKQIIETKVIPKIMLFLDESGN